MEPPQTTTQLFADIKDHLVKSIKYRNKAIRYQKLADECMGMSNECMEIAHVLKVEYKQILALQRPAIIPQTAEFKDILGNLVASGNYNSATNEYVSSNGRKVAHWNASLGKIVPVPAVRSKVISRNKQADPVTHARYLEQQRQRYREKHPAVERQNPFV
jgi:hypothetical protein